MLLETIARARAEREQSLLQRRCRVALTPCAPHQTFAAANPVDPPRDLLSFCSNDYLGLAAHPAVAEAMAEGARLWGAGSGSSHLVGGHGLAHARLEERLAQWLAPHIPEARALFFGTGYMANLAVLATLGTADATVLCEKLNHASLIDGARLSRARLRVFPHLGYDRLETLLSGCDTPLKLIVTDSVFSMDGDLADLPRLLDLAERHDAWIVVDDAHGFGVLGAAGRGALAHFGLRSRRLIYMGTLGKAAGVAGAFVCAHADIVDHLVNAARTYIYTTAAPPAVAHALQASLDLIEGAEGDARRARLRALAAQVRTEVGAIAASAGWELPLRDSVIQPLIVGDNGAALALAAALEVEGLRVPAIRPTTVPEGTARLRISLSAAHTTHDVDRLVAALARAAAAERAS